MIKLNFNLPVGKMKPMHAVNNPPTVPYSTPNYAGTDLYGKLQEAGIPYSRLHDTGGPFGHGRYVDIANIFPDFDADPLDPDSYDFAFTDRLISELINYGIKPFYRLGATIENNHRIKAYNIYPPKDNLKWAMICEGIIRHYNEGWANGFNYDIEYWEIWNEPDNEPEISNNPMWKGTKEQYFELYKTAAVYLKQRFPNIKIGGYSGCGFYALSGPDIQGGWISKCRTDYFLEFFHEFMSYIKKERVPLDFFSWHGYSDVKSSASYAAYVRQQLDEYGYTNAESIFNEWNPGIHNRGTLQNASDICAMMCAMQNTPTDMCMYYSAQINSTYCGLFDPVKFDVFKAYYAFYAFNRLYELKTQVFAESDLDGVYVCAAAQGEKQAVLIVNNLDSCADTMIDGLSEVQANKARCYVVDDENNFEINSSSFNPVDMSLHMNPYGIYLLEI